MTGLTTPLTGGQGLSQQEATLWQARAEIWERSVRWSVTWPTTRLARWCLCSVLAAGLYFPSAVRAAHAWQWLALLALTSALVLTTRALFGALGERVHAQSWPAYLAAAVPPALVATGLMTAGSAIISLGFSPVLDCVKFGTTILTLTYAGVLRAGEIREQRGLRRVYFVGAPNSQRELKRELVRRRDRELVGSRLLARNGYRLSPSALREAILGTHATIVILDREAMLSAEVVEAAAQLKLDGFSVTDFATFHESEFKKIALGELSSIRLLTDAHGGPHSVLGRMLRRAAECWVAAATLVGTFPVMLLAIGAIRLTSPGPALYRQRRVGRGGTPFTLTKLRTMTVNRSAETEACWVQSHPDRVTWIGGQVRRFRIDELPQLWNVLRGDLALIGPRPEQVPIVERLREELPVYGVRHCVRPGITGWAQVNLGYVGSVEGTLAKLQRDLFYIKCRSFRLDALIIWLTLKTVLAGRGS